MDKSKLITDKKLESAFKLFDKDGDGLISLLEIKDILGRDSPNIGDDIWNKIIKEVDLNGDGEISLDEFKKMMEKIVKN